MRTDDPGKGEGEPEGEARAEAIAESRARALALLEATHQFPCAYAITVIAFNREVVTEGIRRVADRKGTGPHEAENDDGDAGYESRASRQGKYLSHRFSVRVSHAGEVLELHALLRSVEGVVTIL